MSCCKLPNLEDNTIIEKCKKIVMDRNLPEVSDSTISTDNLISMSGKVKYNKTKIR